MLTFHHNFKEDKSLAGRAGDSLNCVRASDGGYRNASGQYAIASANGLRSAHDMNGDSLGLFTEEPRTNLMLDNLSPGSANWIVGGNTLVDADATTSPDGTVNADRIKDDNGGGSSSVGTRQNRAVSTSTEYCFSAFLKADGLDWAALRTSSFTTPSNGNSFFDLANGVVGTKHAGHDASGIEDWGNGWYLCWITFTTDAADGLGSPEVLCAEGDNDTNCDRDDTSSIFAWGIQLEAGSYATSMIVTEGSSVTRTEDVINNTSPDGSWLADDSSGSWYVRFAPSGWVQDIDANHLILLNYASGSFGFRVRNGGGGTVQIRQNTSGDDGLVSTSNVTLDTFTRLAGRVAEDDLKLYQDGVDEGQDLTSDVIPGVSMTAIEVGEQKFTGIIEEIAYFDEELTDQQLDDLSTGVLTPAMFSGCRNFIAVTHRGLKGISQRPRMPKPRSSLRSFFE